MRNAAREDRENTLSWIPSGQIEEAALKQIGNLAGMPFIFKHVAVMPDCHYGLGATVGSCIPTLGAIIPAAVGVDIGCGMIAVRTPSGGRTSRRTWAGSERISRTGYRSAPAGTTSAPWKRPPQGGGAGG